MKKFFVIIALIVVVLTGFSAASFAGKKQQGQPRTDNAPALVQAKSKTAPEPDPLVNEPSSWFFCSQASGVSAMLSAYKKGGVANARTVANSLISSSTCFRTTQVFTKHLSGSEECQTFFDACVVTYPATADLSDTDVTHKGYIAIMPPPYFQEYYGKEGFKGDSLIALTQKY